jgi:hypothetical protein
MIYMRFVQHKRRFAGPIHSLDYSSKVMSISKVKSYSMVGMTADKNFKNKKRY